MLVFVHITIDGNGGESTEWKEFCNMITEVWFRSDEGSVDDPTSYRSKSKVTFT